MIAAVHTVTYHRLSGGELFTFWLFVGAIGLLFYMVAKR